MSTATLTRTDASQQSETLTVIVERASSNWCAYTPDDIGVIIATGPTRDKTIESFRAALQSHLKAMRDEGLATPHITHLEVRETLTA